MSLLLGMLLNLQASCVSSLPQNNIPENVAIVLLQKQDSAGNQIPGMQITPSGGALLISEGGTTDSMAIVLNTQPTATVSLNVIFDSTQILINNSAISPQTLTFVPTCPGVDCWSVSQTLTVSAVDDATPETNPHYSPITFTASSTDANYAALSIDSVNAQITDNDTPGVSIVESGGSSSATEGATDTYTIALTSSPTANVAITVASTNSAQAEVNGGASVILNFDNTCPGANCWSTPKTVTISALNDDVAEGAHSSVITHSAVSGDGNYNGIGIVSINFGIVDNDSAGISLVESAGNTAMTEGASDSYTLVLTSEPSANVDITVNADAQTRISGAASQLFTFTSANWNTPQTVTVDAFEDSIAEGNHSATISHVNAVSADPNYSGTTISNVSISITDNDTAGVTVTQSGGTTTLTEGAGSPNDSYTVVLTSEPTVNVTINITTDSQITTSVASLTFTPGNWSSAQTVNVDSVNDDVDEGAHNSTITHSSVSGDANYSGLGVASIITAITDNDTAGVSVTESGGSTDVTEGGATDTYTVVLTSEPTSNVTINISTDSQLSTSVGSLVFTTANWNSGQIVTVTAANDSAFEPSHNSTITQTASSADGKYNGIAVADPVATITDKGYGTVTIDTLTGASTFYTSIALDGPNNVYISYFDDVTNTLKLARSADGGATWTLSTVDDGTAGTIDVGRYNSIKALAGYVYISYFDNTNKDLKLAISSDNGANFILQAVVSANDVGAYSDLDIDIGGPPGTRKIFISYVDATAQDAMVAYSTDNGSTWNTKVIDTTGSATATAIVAGTGGLLFSGYFDNTPNIWRVKQAVNITTLPFGVSSALGVHPNFPTPSDIGMFPNGPTTKVHMCFYTDDTKELKLATTTNNGTTWNTQIVDSSGDMGDYCAISVDGPNYVYISYYDKATYDLKMAISNDSGSSWSYKSIDTAGQTGLATSVVAIGGPTANVHVSYVDLTNKRIRFAKSIDNGTTW